MTSNFVQNPIFSIVMPVYNTQAYIEEAVNSLIEQAGGFFRSTEVILLNDGSKDESGRICASLASKYPENIRYVEKENSGVSDTKNQGIELARGEFVGFLDSDDKYEDSMFASLMSFRERFLEV